MENSNSKTSQLSDKKKWETPQLQIIDNGMILVGSASTYPEGFKFYTGGGNRSTGGHHS